MKILMLGDYSNLHACLAGELRRRGHEVTVVSDRGGHMATEADVTLRRKPGKLGGVAYLYRVMALLPSWKDYDVVQLINPVFLSLKPSKLRMIFDILKRNNRSVFLTLCGDDHYFVKDCVEGKLFRFSEYRIGTEKTPMAVADPEREKGWLSAAHGAYHSHLYSVIDGAMSVLPEYDMSARLHLDPEKLTFTNLPVDLSTLPYSELPDGKPVRILIGIRGGMEIQKGTVKMLGLCQELAEEMPGRVEVRVVKDLTLADYLKELHESHIVIDQLYSYSPATNALQTMAQGRIAASGGQPEYYQMIGETVRPVFCLSPTETDEEIKARLKVLVHDPEKMAVMSREGRALVERHNDVKTVAGKFENHWNRISN